MMSGNAGTRKRAGTHVRSRADTHTQTQALTNTARDASRFFPFVNGGHVCGIHPSCDTLLLFLSSVAFPLSPFFLCFLDQVPKAIHIFPLFSPIVISKSDRPNAEECAHIAFTIPYIHSGGNPLKDGCIHLLYACLWYSRCMVSRVLTPYLFTRKRSSNFNLKFLIILWNVLPQRFFTCWLKWKGTNSLPTVLEYASGWMVQSI